MAAPASSTSGPSSRTRRWLCACGGAGGVWLLVHLLVHEVPMLVLAIWALLGE